MLRDSSVRQGSGRDQGRGQADLESQIGTVQDIPAFCSQLKANLDHLYGRLELRASEYFEVKERYKQEVAELVHLVHSYEGVPGHERELVHARSNLRVKVRQGRIDIEGRKRIADVAFGNYQQTLDVVRTTYEKKISQVLRIPEIEAAIQDAEQKVNQWSGK